MNELQIEIRRESLPGKIGIISARGYINNDGGQAIADAVSILISQEKLYILIDLEGTTIINSIGVSILLEIMEQLMEKKGRLVFSNLTPTIRKTFEIMGLDQFAAVHPNREEALHALEHDGLS